MEQMIMINTDYKLRPAKCCFYWLNGCKHKNNPDHVCNGKCSEYVNKDRATFKNLQFAVIKI